MMQPNEKGTRKDLVLYRIETSKSDIKAAEILLEAKEFRGANNRAYYGIYHAISAVHALDGNAYKRHKDALENFNNNYIICRGLTIENNRKDNNLHIKQF